MSVGLTLDGHLNVLSGGLSVDESNPIQPNEMWQIQTQRHLYVRSSVRKIVGVFIMSRVHRRDNDAYMA